MDAYKFGQTLKEKIALPNGVIFIEDDAISAPLNANGEIDYIETANHGKIKSDLYIDCTAFKSFLIGQSLNVPFESFSDVLVNDRAVVANIPYFDKEKELTVWANCTTLKNGWLWNIPTWDRLGTGYVYSSRFVDDETALKEFKEGLRVEYGNRADNIEARYVKFTPGARKKMWHKNVLAIGLSAGFLEPLRSTGLMMTHNNILRVVSLLSTKNCFVNSIDKDMFNRQSKNEILLYKDNVAAHYAFCRRKDSEYWRYVTEEINYVDNSIEFSKLADNLDSNQISFSVRVLTGMGFNPISDFALTQLKESNKINFPLLEKIMRDWKDRKNIIDNYTKNLPSNLEFHKQKIYKD
jgi:tryptophan halogenase